jgi:hypothetical protein
MRREASLEDEVDDVERKRYSSHDGEDPDAPAPVARALNRDRGRLCHDIHDATHGEVQTIHKPKVVPLRAQDHQRQHGQLPTDRMDPLTVEPISVDLGLCCLERHSPQTNDDFAREKQRVARLARSDASDDRSHGDAGGGDERRAFGSEPVDQCAAHNREDGVDEGGR